MDRSTDSLYVLTLTIHTDVCNHEQCDRKIERKDLWNEDLVATNSVSLESIQKY